MKLKFSCLLSVCFLMGSCSGGTSGNVSDSGTSAYPSTSSTPVYLSSNPSTSTYTPSTSGANLAAQNYAIYSNNFNKSFAASNCSFAGGTYNSSAGKCNYPPSP